MISADDFDYPFSDGLIAQTPAEPRDSSKLLVVDRKNSNFEHHIFSEIENFLGDGDVLVLNQSKVFPARIKAKKDTGGKVELLLLRKESEFKWWALSTPGLNPTHRIVITDSSVAEVVEKDQLTGEVLLQFKTKEESFEMFLNQVGQTPIPPYISASMDEEELRQKYQTTFAAEVGSAAAPTAGLHFTNELLDRLQAKGVQIELVTLHVGPGTFQRLWAENISSKKLHTEYYEIKPDVAMRLNKAKVMGKRIVAVGTTSVRTLESSCLVNQRDQLLVSSEWQHTELFIYPPYQFRFVDAMITNFHIPKSSLLMLVTAFASKPQTSEDFTSFRESMIRQAYLEAIERDYRFFSFGDAMFLV